MEMSSLDSAWLTLATVRQAESDPLDRPFLMPCKKQEEELCLLLSIRHEKDGCIVLKGRVGSPAERVA